MATLYGFNGYVEWDALPWLTPFATVSFVEGWDQTHGVALPGIPPLQARLGLRLHGRPAATRPGVSSTRPESWRRKTSSPPTSVKHAPAGSSYTTSAAFWQPRSNVQLLAGIENIGNLQYREHLDLRTGFGAFQPGINFYGGVRLSY